MKLSLGDNLGLKLLALILALAVYYSMKSKTEYSSQITFGNDRPYEKH